MKFLLIIALISINPLRKIYYPGSKSRELICKGSDDIIKKSIGCRNMRRLT